METKNLLYIGEYIENRLYFVTIKNDSPPAPNEKYYYFTIDNELVYENFYFDFGPLNLSMLYRYCIKLSKILNTFPDKVIVHCTSMNAQKRSNAAFLIASFAMLYLNRTVEEALTPLINRHIPPFLPFRDATTTESIFNVSLKDCLQAIYRAHALGFFRFNDFNLNEYEHYERVEEGDMNWIVPQKFLAFSGPQSYADRENSQEHTPEYYFSYFKNNHVTNIIRLNKKSYDANRFIDSGFQHNDLYFLDGSTPSNLILDKFFKITENAKGAIAVHCKAGLGRTGSVIACYLMKHYRFNVGEAIAWVRICRPGSIIGIQQKWLHAKKPQLWIDGNRYRKQQYGSANYVPTHKFGIYSKEIHSSQHNGHLFGELLYEPMSAKRSSELSTIVQDIGAIRLNDKDEAQQQPKKIESPVIRNLRSRPNLTQGDHLYQIKAARKPPRSLSTTLAPAVPKSRMACPKPKLIPTTRIYDIPVTVSKPAYGSKPTQHPDASKEYGNTNGTINGSLISTMRTRSRKKENFPGRGGH